METIIVLSLLTISVVTVVECSSASGKTTVNPQIRLAGLILFSWLQMRVLLEIEHFCLLFFKFSAGLIRIRVLLEGESYLRIYGNHSLKKLRFSPRAQSITHSVLKFSRICLKYG